MTTTSSSTTPSTPRFTAVGMVVADMAAALAFYRRLGLDVPAEADGAPHAEAQLPGGLRLMWDTQETARAIDPDWTPPQDGTPTGLAFECAGPAGVDAVYAEAHRRRLYGREAAVGCVLGTALRRRTGPGRPWGRSVRAAAPGGGRGTSVRQSPGGDTP
ncbi:VOC family protein [Streptomyces sp. MS1.AVA.3]